MATREERDITEPLQEVDKDFDLRECVSIVLLFPRILELSSIALNEEFFKALEVHFQACHPLCIRCF